jgi:DNA-binding transcriptional MocR family regulator
MTDTQLPSLDLHERSGQSKHQRLHEHLVAQIATGRLKPGQKLASEHSLVRTLGVACTTIRQAMARRLTSVVGDEIGTGRRAVELLHEMRCGDRPIDDNEEIVLKLTRRQGDTLAAPLGRQAVGVFN